MLYYRDNTERCVSGEALVSSHENPLAFISATSARNMLCHAHGEILFSLMKAKLLGAHAAIIYIANGARCTFSQDFRISLCRLSLRNNALSIEYHASRRHAAAFSSEKTMPPRSAEIFSAGRRGRAHRNAYHDYFAYFSRQPAPPNSNAYYGGRQDTSPAAHSRVSRESGFHLPAMAADGRASQSLGCQPHVLSLMPGISSEEIRPL